MIVITFFKSTSAKVIFISSCINKCFLKNALRKTVTIHWTVCFWQKLQILIVDGAGSFIYFRIMFLDEIIHDTHATNFNLIWSIFYWIACNIYGVKEKAYQHVFIKILPTLVFTILLYEGLNQIICLVWEILNIAIYIWWFH